MTTLFTLRTNGTELLLPGGFDQALARIHTLSPSAPRGVMAGQELRLATSLELADDACAGFVLEFAAQGARVQGSAHGPSAALLAWALHAIAEKLGCPLEETGARITPAPDLTAATAYLASYEGSVLATRSAHRDPDPDAFVRWLAREEHVALAGDATFADLPLDDAEAAYEQLLDHEAVEEVFVSERELSRLLARFKAWSRSGRRPQ